MGLVLAAGFETSPNLDAGNLVQNRDASAASGHDLRGLTSYLVACLDARGGAFAPHGQAHFFAAAFLQLDGLCEDDRCPSPAHCQQHGRAGTVDCALPQTGYCDCPMRIPGDS